MSDDSVIDELSPGPEPEQEDETRPDPSSEEQQQELDEMLEGSESGGGQTSGQSDPTRAVSSEESDGPDASSSAEVKAAEQEEALENTKSEPEGTPEPSATVEEVLESEGVESVGEIARQYQEDERTGVPALCEHGCNIQPGQLCPHDGPAITDVE